MATKQKKDNDVLLSEEEVQQVWEFYQFTQGMSGGGMYGPGALTPMLVSQRMKDKPLKQVWNRR